MGAARSVLASFWRPTPSQLKTKPLVILITCAAQGIGQATALALVARGHVVYGADVQAMPAFEAAGGHVLSMDITQDADVQEGVKRILHEQQGRIDGVINNAGLFQTAPAELTLLDVTNRESIWHDARHPSRLAAHACKKRRSHCQCSQLRGPRVHTLCFHLCRHQACRGRMERLFARRGGAVWEYQSGHH